MPNATRFILALIMGACLALTGCEDDGGDSASVNLTGTWSVLDNEGDRWVLSLTQSGSSLSGSMQQVGDVDVETITGSVSGYSVTFQTSTGTIATGTVNTSGNSMGGTLANSGTGDAGTWSATRQS